MNRKNKERAYQLKLHRHQAEVDDLHGRPDEVVGLERGEEHVADLLQNGPAAAALGHRHDGEEPGDAKGRKHELVHGHALHGWHKGAALGQGEASLEEAEPLELDGRHAEAVGHEARQPLKVKGRRQRPGLGYQVAVQQRVLAVQLVDLYRQPVFARVQALAQCPLPDGRNGLRHRIGHAAKHRVGHHHREY